MDWQSATTTKSETVEAANRSGIAVTKPAFQADQPTSAPGKTDNSFPRPDAGRFRLAMVSGSRADVKDELDSGHVFPVKRNFVRSNPISGHITSALK